MRRWSTREIRYLSEHAGDGAEAIAEALDRSVDSVRAQASRCGISLRRRWQCPRCGRMTYQPLNRRTGWCQSCTKEEHVRELKEQALEMREEAVREKKANQERQRWYSRKHSAKKKKKK